MKTKLMSIAKPLAKSNPSGVKYIKKIAVTTRSVKCPVRSHYFSSPTMVTEYAIPVKLITTDKNTQPRKKGRDQKKIAELADSFLYTGQDEGACVEIVSDARGNTSIRLRWGSHRKEATETLTLRGETIKDLDPHLGCLWVNLYNYQRSELRRFQSIENNLSKPYQPADSEDNLSTLEDEASSGELDLVQNGIVKKFVDMKEEEQRKQLVEYISTYMPAYASAKKKSALIKSFFNSTTNSFKSDTMSKRQMVEYYNNNNSLGLKFEYKGTTIPIITDKEGIRHKLVVMTDPMKGANMQTIQVGREKSKFDCVHIVQSLDRKDLTDAKKMAEKRTANGEFFKYWHTSISKVKVVDFLYQPPQTTPELQAAKTSCAPWISIDKY